jgi:SEC-C motif-containing protein
MNCPCRLGQLSSGQTFDRCCGQFISHRALPENATQLMRSRYSAYTLGDQDYLQVVEQLRIDECSQSGSS